MASFCFAGDVGRSEREKGRGKKKVSNVLVSVLSGVYLSLETDFFL